MDIKKIKNELLKQKESKFRSRFHLKDKDKKYIEEKGIDTIEKHAYDFINNRLSDVSKVIDGKQTPMRGHPVFIAQHATACCCRGCLEKWHHIPKDRLLTKKEIDYIANIIMKWINNEMNRKD